MVHMFLSRNLDEDSAMEYDVLASPQPEPCSRRRVGAVIVDADGNLSPTAQALVFESRLRNLRDEVSLPPQYRIVIARDTAVPGGRFFFQIEADRLDAYTGKMGTGRGGPAYLDARSTDSELIQTIFGLYKAYLEHEARETFLYKGRRVFGPHMDINAVWEVADTYDASPSPNTPTKAHCTSRQQENP